MKNKDYQNFIDSLTIEDKNTIKFKAESQAKTKGDFEFFTSLYLIEMYHNWLSR